MSQSAVLNRETPETTEFDPYSIPLEKLDMSNGDYFQNQQHWALFERLRKEDPVHFCDSEIIGRFWLITRYHDIVAVDTNHKQFSSEPSIFLTTLQNEAQSEESGLQAETFVAMDQPKHDVQRKAVTSAVAPAALAELEPLIRERVGKVLDSLPVGESFNWVEKVSIEMTTRMLAVLFDFPFEDRRKLTRWSDVAMSIPGDGITESWESRKAEMLEMKSCFERLWRERRTNTGGFDLVSMLATTLDDSAMSPDEYMGNVVLLIVGGHDTTRNSLSGSVLALNRFPAENTKLRANPDLIPNFVSEAIRWQTPVAHMKRTALEDTEIRGQKIRAGEKVVMWYVSGNRDEEMFERPYELIADRPRARSHLSFGFGLHRCVGNRLGELQLRIAWEEILKRFEIVEVVGDPVRVYSNITMGYSDLPVRVKRY